ncbi:MAG: cell division protein ZapA [Nitrosomonas sp.]|nr:cell division protein ZapA [Nitrosomonas sp.]MDP1950489.1 cell division protein ZapA [Nitrosomonas sp.]
MKTEKAIDVTIMGREFRLNCPDEESEELLLAADYLDKKMHKIRQEGKVVGSERIAIIAALSITHELLLMQSGSGFDIGHFRRRIERMEEKVDHALVE